MTALDSAIALLENLEAITPPAPADDADPSEIASDALRVDESRREPLAQLRRLVDAAPGLLSGNDRAAELLDALTERGLRWQEALGRARQAMSHRMAALRRIRQARRR